MCSLRGTFPNSLHIEKMKVNKKFLTDGRCRCVNDRYVRNSSKYQHSKLVHDLQDMSSVAFMKCHTAKHTTIKVPRTVGKFPGHGNIGVKRADKNNADIT